MFCIRAKDGICGDGSVWDDGGSDPELRGVPGWRLLIYLNVIA